MPLISIQHFKFFSLSIVSASDPSNFSVCAAKLKVIKERIRVKWHNWPPISIQIFSSLIVGAAFVPTIYQISTSLQINKDIHENVFSLV